MKTVLLLAVLPLAGCAGLSAGAASGAAAGFEGRPLPPAPYSPATDPTNWLAYTISGIIAYAAGSAGKGYIRSRAERKGK